MNEQLPVIDWQQHARANTDSTDMSRELLALFIQQLPELQQRFQQAFVSQNKQELHAILHRLQGACAYCGLPRLRKTVVDIAHDQKQTGQLSKVQFEQALQEIAAVKKQLAEHGIH